MLDLRLPPRRPLIAASILSADFGRMIDDCRQVLSEGGESSGGGASGGADLLHVDVMDGHFVGNLTMGPDMVRALRRHLPGTFLDVHLMVDHPGMFVQPFADAGTNHVTFHLEVCDPVRARWTDAKATLAAIHRAGMTAGLALNPLTDIAGVEPYLEHLDLVLVMSVHPGKSGQAFMPAVLDKVRWLKPRLGPGTRIEMDGGLNPSTAAAAIAAGVDVLVTASALFGAEDRAGVIRAMRGK